MNECCDVPERMAPSVSRAASPRRHRLLVSGPTMGAVAIVLLLLVSGLAAASTTVRSPVTSAAGSSVPVTAGHATIVAGSGASVPTTTATVAAHAAAKTAAPASPHPAASSGRGTFFENSVVPNPAAGTNFCPYTYFCWNDTNEPASNQTTSGYTGVAYTAYTNASACPAMQGNTTVPDANTEIGFVASANFGSSWSAPIYLGNPSCTGDDSHYSSAFQPSLTSLPNGTFVLAYIEYNYTAQTTYSYTAPPENMYCSYYYHLAYDRLVVSFSYNNGASWSIPTVVNETNLSSCPTSAFPALRPSITATGNTIYLAWETVSTPLYVCCSVNVKGSVYVVTSTDGGVTWGSPQSLTATSGYTSDYSDSTDLAANPNVMVDPSGRLYVGYTTGLSSSYVSTPCCSYAYTSIVRVATSTDNGSTFSYATVDSSAGWMSTDYPSYYFDPAPVLAYNALSGQAYIVYAAQAMGNFCYNDGIYGYYCSSYETAETVFVSNSSTSGSSWAAPSNILPTTLINPNGGWASAAYNPSMAIDAGGTIHVQFAFANNGVCQSYQCALDQQYYMNSTDGGATWSTPVIVYPFASMGNSPGHYFYDAYWQGSYTSMVTSGHDVMLAWTLAACPAFGYCYGGYMGGAEVVTSTLYQGVGISLTFTETGLGTGVPWTAAAQGNLFSALAGSSIVISGVPPSQVIQFNVDEVNASYGVQYLASLSTASPASFALSTTITATYTEQVLVNVLTVPTIDYYYLLYGYANYIMSPGPGSAWVSLGTVSTNSISPSAYTFCYYCLNLSFQSWTGSGNGSTSTKSYNVTYTANGPVNETANFNFIGWCINPTYGSGCTNVSYPLTFEESGLPSGTEWGLTITNQSTGLPDEYTSTASNITLLVGTSPLQYTLWTVPSASSGQFWIPSTTVIDPVTALTNPVVPVSFTLGSASSATFTTVVQESGLPNGTAWSLELGSATYGVDASSITLALGGGGPYAVNGSYVYLEGGDGYYASSITIDPYVINETSSSSGVPASYTANGPGVITVTYSPMFYLTLTATVGGSVSPSSQWVRNGGSVTLGETPSPGYHFVGWTGTGTGSVSTASTSPTVSPHAPVVELATFRPNAPPTWNITLVATGLPGGVSLSVSLGGVTYTGIGPFKVGNLTAGNYSVETPIVFLNGTQTTRFVPTGVTSSLQLSGGMLELNDNGSLSVDYQAQYAASLVATPGGAITAPTSGAGTYWFNATESVTLTAAPSAGFMLVSWVGAGPGSVNSTALSITVTPTGPITETAQFLPQPIRASPTFVLTVTESGLPSSVSWSVVVGAGGASGTGASLTVRGLNGSYLLTAPTIYTGAGTRWVSDTTNVSEDVTSNATYTVTYSQQFFVSVSAGSGGNATASAWVPASSSVTLTATPDSGQEFLSWNGTGAGWTNATSATVTFTVTGPVAIQATFAPIPPPPAKQTTGSTSTTNGLLLSFGLLVALLVVGLVIGMLLARRGGRQPPMQEYGPTEPAEPAAEAPAEEPSGADVYSEGPPSS